MTDLLPDDQNTRQATNQARSEAGNHAIRDSQPAGPAIKLRNTTLFDTIFLNRNGLRAGWRVALYVVIFSLFLAICQSAAGFLHGAVLIQRGGRLTPQILLVQELALATSAIAAALVMKAIEGRRFDEYGMPLRSAFQRDFWHGSLWGMAQISALMLLIYALGGYSFGLRAVYGHQLIRYAVLWAIFFIIVGIAEEFLFRGYLLFTLSSAVGFWPAAILMAVLFGGAHLQNPGESLAGAASVFLFGLFLSLTLRRTGTLWFAIGLHAAFDFGETFIFSVPDSGIVMPGQLFSASLHGPRWLTGGSVGPEGSVMSFIVLAIISLLFARLHRRTAQPADAIMPGDPSSAHEAPGAET